MPPTRYARRVSTVLALVLGVGPAPGAHADPLVTVSATRNGSVVEVTGSAVLADGPQIQVAQDVSGDATGAQLTGDLTGVSLITESDGDFAVRWSLVAVPSSPNGTAGVARFRFRAGSTDYEVAAARTDATGFDGCTSNNLPCRGGWLVRCGTATCSWSPQGANGGGTVLSRDVTMVFDSAIGGVQATVPAGALVGVLTPGQQIEPYAGSPSSEASTSVGQLELSREIDTAEMTGTYVYGLTVRLAAADPESDPASLEYPVAATVAQNNAAFSGELDVPPGQAVFAKACLGGPTNCAYGRSAVV